MRECMGTHRNGVPVNILNSDFHRSLHVNFGLKTLQALNFHVGQQEMTNISAICLCQCLSVFPTAIATNTLSTHCRAPPAISTKSTVSIRGGP